MSRRNAFSLVELTVVIGIIAVLLSLLLPALNMVRANAKSDACLSNLRQISAAALVYSMDNEGCTVPGYKNPGVSSVSGNTQGGDGENYATTLVNGRYLKYPLVNGLYDQVSTQTNVFHCPAGSDDFLFSEFTVSSAITGVTTLSPSSRTDGLGARPLRTISQSSGVIIDTWYGINSCLDNTATGGTPCVRIPINNVSGAAASMLPHITQIKSPSKMVFLFDGIFYNLEFCGDRINARHNGGTVTNIVFFDGHAEAIQTSLLPGKMGGNGPGAGDRFSTSALGTNSPRWDWRLDQR